MDKALYKQEIEKQAAIGATLGTLASKVAPTVAKGAKAFASMNTGKRALIGAGTNAALKGLTYKPATGQDSVKGRLGAMAGGALSGAVAGGLASKSNLSNLGSKISSAGDKVFNSATNMASNKASNAIGNIGIHMNTIGNKIKNHFGN